MYVTRCVLPIAVIATLGACDRTDDPMRRPSQRSPSVATDALAPPDDDDTTTGGDEDSDDDWSWDDDVAWDDDESDTEDWCDEPDALICDYAE